MNLTIMRAMFEDARQQVLDNKVFRLLVILTGIPILFSFLIGFNEEHISLLFGWKEIPYKEFMENFGGTANLGTEEVNVLFIQGVQSLFLSVFAGMFGMMLCIAATAFFAPRILEKGAADTVFSKPVSRMTVLMSRYLAGILFVAFISIILVVGMYLGFFLVSGYNDPGFLWGALTLVYLYAMMHAFSTAVAVWTRSSTAAILLTIILFMICGAVHGGWIGMKYFEEQEFVTQLRAQSDDDEEEGEEEEDGSAILEVLTNTLSVLHYTLPKTSDADMITEKLKRAVTENDPQIETDDGDLIVKSPPGEFTIDESTRDSLDSTGVVWVSSTDGGAMDGTVTMRRYERPKVEKTIAGKTRIRSLTGKDVSKAFIEELEEKGEAPNSDDTSLSDLRVYEVMWSPISGSTQNRRLIFNFGDYLYEIDFVLADGRDLTSEDGSATSGTQIMDEREERQWRFRFLRNGNIVLGQVAGMTPDVWYDKVFDWDSELKYNIFFSIGSSLLFILAMLGLTWFKLRRIDF